MFGEPKAGKSQIHNKKLFEDGYMVLNAAIAQVGHSAEKAAAAMLKLAQSIGSIITKEYKIMEMKLVLMQARLQTLEGRSTECGAIRKKLIRQIRNLKAKMAATLVA
jgi:hypothetical protein